MMPQEETQQRLHQLKKVIDNSDNVKADVKELIKNAAIHNIDAEVPLEKENAYSLYSFRYKLLLEKGKSNQNWADLLVRLEHTYNDSPVTITALHLESKSYIIFTDNEYKEYFGIIY